MTQEVTERRSALFKFTFQMRDLADDKIVLNGSCSGLDIETECQISAADKVDISIPLSVKKVRQLRDALSAYLSEVEWSNKIKGEGG